MIGGAIDLEVDSRKHRRSRGVYAPDALGRWRRGAGRASRDGIFPPYPRSVTPPRLLENLVHAMIDRSIDRSGSVSRSPALSPTNTWVVRGPSTHLLQVQAKPFGIYMGFHVREAWRVPDGEDAQRGDTLIMVALKCRMTEAVAFLVE